MKPEYKQLLLNKQLLLKDLCGRLPYKTYIEIVDKDGNVYDEVELDIEHINTVRYYGRTSIRPYLRPMSSITEKEKEELYHYYCKEIADNLNTPNLTWELRCCVSNSFGTDWLNEHHFDYRGLIERGLALEAPAKIKKN